MIRGRGSNPRISNVTRPHDPGSGGVVRLHPGSSDGRKQDVYWKLAMDRYGKPVLSPNIGLDMPESGCSVRKQSFGGSVTEAQASRNVTRPSHVGGGRVGQPRQTPVRGDGVTCPDPTRVNRGSSVVTEATTVANTLATTVPAGYHIPSLVPVDDNWHEVLTKHRIGKLWRTQVSSTAVSELDDFDTHSTCKTVVVDRHSDPGYAVRPDSGPAKVLAVGGPSSDSTTDSKVRCLNCHTKRRNYGTVRSSGHIRKPLSRRSQPIVKRSAPIVHQRIPSEDMEPMHYQWILRNSITNTDRPVPYNYLDIPDQNLPSVLLNLAEEARKVVVIN